MSKRISVLILFAVLVLVLVAILLFFPSTGKKPFSLVADAQREAIALWQYDEDTFYCFLPYGFSLADCRIQKETTGEVHVNGRALADGEKASFLATDTLYELDYVYFGRKKSASLTFLHSEEMPSLHLDTRSGNMDHIHADRNNEETGSFRLYSSRGELWQQGNVDRINGRGNNSWNYFDKKSYGVTLSGEADLLGMGKASEWVLLSNAADSSQVRNKLAYDFYHSQEMPYSLDCQWVELFLNGEYAGLYLLCERSEVHTERVDLGEGSILFSFENERLLKEKGTAYYKLKSGKTVRIYASSLSEQARTSFMARLQSLENAFLSEDGVDPQSGKHWKDMIDVESFLKKYLFSELMGNSDAGLASEFFCYNAADTTFYAGPVWDFDHALGSDIDSWCITDPSIMVATRPTGGVQSVFRTMCLSDNFHSLAKQLYLEKGEAWLASLKTLLAAYEQKLSGGTRADRIRQKTDGGRSFSRELDRIEAYLTDHAAFLLDSWQNDRELLTVFANDSVGAPRYYSLQPNQTVSIPNQEDRDGMHFIGWYDAETNEPFDETQPITSDRELYAVWEENTQKTWSSALKLAPFVTLLVMLALLFIIGGKRYLQERRCRREK